MKLLIFVFCFISFQIFSQEYSVEEELYNLPFIELNRVDHLRSSVDLTANNADDNSSLGEENGRAILFDSYGPGEIFRFWKSEPTIFDTLYFYFDGEKEPSLVLNQFDLYFGEYEGSQLPISYDRMTASGGAFSYIRIRYNNRLKILTNTDRKIYYQIDYAEYKDDRVFDNGIYSPEENLEIFDGLNGWNSYESGSQFTYKLSDISSTSSKSFSIEKNSKTRLKRFEMNISDLTLSDPLNRIEGWAYAYKESSSFNLDVDPENEGVMLIKRTDPKGGWGMVETDVYIDGDSAARFSGVPWNYNIRFENDTCYIPSEFTKGKNKINILQKVRNEDGEANESYFWLYNKIDGEYIKGDETTVYWWEGGNESQYRVEGYVWDGRIKFTYRRKFNPNRELNSDILYNTFLRVYFDGKKEASIDAPLGMFFGISTFEAVHTNSMVSGIDSNGTLFTNLPMIFDENCKFEIYNNTSTTLSNIDFKLYYENENSDRSYGYLTTRYNEKLPISGPKDHVFGDVVGSGKYLGVVYESDQKNAFDDGHLEGDERFIIDGMTFPLHHGTGTEDYFNGAFYFVNGPFETPFGGQPFVDSLKRSMYRYQIFDAYHFLSRGKFSMEHGTNNTGSPYHRSLAFFYLNDTTLIHPTDSLLISDSLSLVRTNYQIEGDFEDYTINSAFLNEDFHIREDKLARKHNSRVSFSANIYKDNEGIRIMRLFDDSLAYQAANVFIDGEFIGLWESPGQNIYMRFREDIFDISKEFTEGKEKVEIVLEPIKDRNYSEIKYVVFSKGIKPKEKDPDTSIRNLIEIDIFPNPTRNEINIQTIKPIGNYQIIDLNGNIYLHGNILNNKVRISINSLPAGVYMFKSDKYYSKVVKQ